VARFNDWVSALEERHLANLRVPELTRALRALSSAYIERRHKVAAGATLDSAGKRAAFALFFAPLHYLTVAHVVAAAQARVPQTIVDVGCGSGAAGAAWAMSGDGRSRIVGFDRHPWAVEEARWTYRFFELQGTARVGDAVRLPQAGRDDGIVAAYVLNELADEMRSRVEDGLLAAASRGAAVIVIEPIARSLTPWWEATAVRVRDAGGRVDEWKFPVTLPAALEKFDRAAGLRHHELKARTLMLNI
jgi:protein-L-isoaspartate O-methyltransferase